MAIAIHSAGVKIFLSQISVLEGLKIQIGFT